MDAPSKFQRGAGGGSRCSQKPAAQLQPGDSVLPSLPTRKRHRILEIIAATIPQPAVKAAPLSAASMTIYSFFDKER